MERKQNDLVVLESRRKVCPLCHMTEKDPNTSKQKVHLPLGR